jgi:hypothetical protein
MASKNPSASLDAFPNMAIVTVTETAANTLTFKKLESAVGFLEKIAWVINRVEYFISYLDSAKFNSDLDALNFGFAVSNAWSSAVLSEVTIVDFNQISRKDIGTAATGMFSLQPFVKDFENLPGGGLLVPPNPFYLWAVGSGLAAANGVTARVYYQSLQLDSAEAMWQLIESRRVLSS